MDQLMDQRLREDDARASTIDSRLYRDNWLASSIRSFQREREYIGSRYPLGTGCSSPRNVYDSRIETVVLSSDLATS